MIIVLRSLSISLLFGTTLIAEYGCMDNSYHLAQLNDPKNYYIVTGADGGPCSCPCSRHCAQYRCSLAKGQCPVCGHYRVPRPYVIVQASKGSLELPPARKIGHLQIPIMRNRLSNQLQKP